ncbi:MAG TPA: hypothetical protein VK636_20165, partial [Gemmatimonadaceae bacterium]|nr:hypothetical protein [Gemmatimonadaceae bacterium]
TFELFARPLIRTQRGERDVFRRTIEVRAGEDFTIGAPLTHFLRAIVDWTADGPQATLTGPQGSGLLTSMSRANALVIVPPERPVVRAGEAVRALMLGEAALASNVFDV